MYNTTNLTDAVDIQQQFVAVNQLSGGFLGIGLLALSYLIIFIVFKHYENDTKKTFLFTATICMILAILMWGAELIYINVLAYPMVILFASLLIYKFSD